MSSKHCTLANIVKIEPFQYSYRIKHYFVYLSNCCSYSLVVTVLKKLHTCVWLVIYLNPVQIAIYVIFIKLLADSFIILLIIQCVRMCHWVNFHLNDFWKAGSVTYVHNYRIAGNFDGGKF